MANLRTNNLSGEQGQNAYRGSVFFDGTDDYLSFADSSDFVLGTGDFTVEAWFLVSTNLDYRSLIDTRTSVNDDCLNPQLVQLHLAIGIMLLTLEVVGLMLYI